MRAASAEQCRGYHELALIAAELWADIPILVIRVAWQWLDKATGEVLYQPHGAVAMAVVGNVVGGEQEEFTE